MRLPYQIINCSIFILLFIVLLSCKKDQDSIYQYEADLKNYLSEVHDIKNRITDDVFYIIPVYSCSPCVKKNMNFLANYEPKKPINVILVGETPTFITDGILKAIGQKYVVYSDPKNDAQFYELGLGKPILIEYKKGNPVHYQQIGDDQINEIINYLSLDE